MAERYTTDNNMDGDARTRVRDTDPGIHDDPEIHDPAVTPPMTTGAPVRHEPSIGELFSELSSDFSTLMRQEVQLARAETVQAAKNATRSVVTMVAGGLVAYTGLLGILAGITILVGLWLNSLWLAALAVGVIVLVIGVILIFSGRAALENISMTPEKTVETLQDDAKWAKEKVNESV